MKNEYLFAALVLSLTLAGGAYWFVSRTPPDGADMPLPADEIPDGVYVVTLTTDGFQPDRLSIPIGATVAFRSTTGDMFWPASNLHPSHLIYPEFDPQKPIQQNAVWTFTFTKAGEWEFHDHLAPYYTGVITVTE